MLTWHWSWTHPTLAAMAADLAPQQAFTSRCVRLLSKTTSPCSGSARQLAKLTPLN